MTDLLTGLPTRHQLHLRLPELAVAANMAAPLTLLLLKIKDFSLWQSHLTPLAADRLLGLAAQVIQENCPPRAYPARWSGATFALLIPDCPLWQAEEHAERLREAAARQELPAIFNYEGLVLDFVSGCSTLPPQDIWQLATAAEAELKRAQGGVFGTLSMQPNLPAEREILLRLGRSFLAQSGPYLPRLSMLTSSLALATGRRMGLSTVELADLELAAGYADIALTETAGQALTKPGALTAGEYRKICRHPIFAAQLCRNLNLGEQVTEAVLYHHERPDGNGYPEGLNASQIPRLAAILAAASIYASLLLPRPYRPARRPFTARAEINLLAGKAVDAEVAHHLLLVESIGKSRPVI